MAAYEAAKEIVWLRDLLKELGFEQKEPTVIFEDNMSTIEIATKFNTQHKRTKHYNVRCAYLKSQVRTNVIQFKYIKNENQIADVLTKALVKSQHQKLSNLLMGNVEDCEKVLDESQVGSKRKRYNTEQHQPEEMRNTRAKVSLVKSCKEKRVMNKYW